MATTKEKINENLNELEKLKAILRTLKAANDETLERLRREEETEEDGQ